ALRADPGRGLGAGAARAPAGRRARGLFDDRVRVTAETLAPAGEAGLMLLDALGALADAVGRGRPAPLEVFLQVSMDSDPDRGGVPIDRLSELGDLVAARPELVLRGVMTVLPLGVEPDDGYARLAELSQQLRADHPQASAISAGMSGDLEAAVRNGSTHVRVGTALLGRREQVLG
ncbi:MAG: dependent protein, partial [Pseudonocardiales bacterium]|nr:dependent protein [Pseudonocardiales bacterium]